jgi:dTDP-4-amino-4,6-dideoxygalactose transaminase
MIPFAAPLEGYLAHKEQIDAAIQRVLASGSYILGPEVAAFETAFAAWTGSAHCVGVGNGTEALHLALAALGVGPGHEVITVSLTAVATAAAIVQTGARPVFVDIDPETLTMDPRCLEKAVGPLTRAIVPVHLYGHPCPMDEILAIAARHGLPVVEDCAQAHGAECDGKRVGSLGSCGCFSFYPTKNLGAFGDGGAITTDDPELAARIRKMREYGWEDRVSQGPGWNSRLDELQAAILNVKLMHLKDDLLARNHIAEHYLRGLADSALKLPTTRAGVTHAYHLFVVQSARRDQLVASLKSAGIAAGIHYPLGVHEQPAFRSCFADLPNTLQAARTVLSLPMYPTLEASQCEKVVREIGNIFASC